MWWDDPRAYRDYSPMIRRPAGTNAELDPPRVPLPARRVAAGGARQDPPGDPGLPGLGRAVRLQPPARPGKAPAGLEVFLSGNVTGPEVVIRFPERRDVLLDGVLVVGGCLEWPRRRTRRLVAERTSDRQVTRGGMCTFMRRVYTLMHANHA